MSRITDADNAAQHVSAANFLPGHSCSWQCVGEAGLLFARKGDSDMTYEIREGGLRRIDAPPNDKRNSLPIGTVLHLNGYDNPEFVVVKNLGVDQKYGQGAQYLTVCLDDGTFRRHDAYTLKHIREKADGRIQTYWTDEIVDSDRCLALYEKAQALESLAQNQKREAEKTRDEMIARGKEVAARFIPREAEAVIVAELEQDESEIMTDYFATKTTQIVVLAWSSHKRDLFPELRKSAGKCDKTAHLAEPNPENEHREKYSMGAGYYLKASSRYSSGWTVQKRTKRDYGWDNDIYISLAQVNLIKI